MLTETIKGKIMKILTKIATIALILGTSSLFASNSNSYTISNNYKLLNDISYAKKQQHLILDMSRALKINNVDMKAYEKFTKVLLGLLNGDDSLNLRGTEIPEIRAELNRIQELWKEELITLKSANSDIDITKAIDILNGVMAKMNQLVALYNKSFDRFQQKSRLSLIVEQYKIANERQIVAFNMR